MTKDFELKHALLFVKKLKHRNKDIDVIEDMLEEQIDEIENKKLTKGDSNEQDGLHCERRERSKRKA